MKIRIILLLLVIIPLFCKGQRKEYNTAISKGNAKSIATNLHSFLKKFPDSKFTEKAKQAKLVACNKWAKEISRSRAYNSSRWKTTLLQFTGNCSKSDSIHAFKNILLKAEWKNAVSKNTVQVYNDFQLNYPNSIYKTELQEKLEKLALQNAIAKDSLKFYRQFLEEYPNSNKKHIIDSLVNAINIFALPKAAKKGNLLATNKALPDASIEMKSRALMEAIRGALYTIQSTKFDNNTGNISFIVKRKSEIARETYMSIIKLLIKEGASPKLFSYLDFGSVEVRENKANNALKKQVSKTGSGSISYKIGGEENETLIPYGNNGISAIDVIKIHKALDILELLE